MKKLIFSLFVHINFIEALLSKCSHLDDEFICDFAMHNIILNTFKMVNKNVCVDVMKKQSPS